MNRESLASIFSLVTPFKIIISALITIFSGTTYFAIINKIAMYYYSIQNGFRLPAEGSPFITIAISTVSFLILMGAALLYLILILFSYTIKKTQSKLEIFYDEKIKNIIKSGEHNIRLRIYKYLKSSANKPIGMKFSIIMSAFLPVLSLFVVHFSLESPPLKAYIILFLLSGLYPVFILSPFIPFRKTVLSIVTLIFMVLSPILLLDSESYTKILKSINYGGYSPIELHMGEKTINNAVLVFRSSESIFISIQGQNKVSEIPLKDVTSIDYLKNPERIDRAF